MEAIAHIPPTGDRVDIGFSVVLADPPWLHRSNSLAAPGRNPRRHYSCLTVEQLCTLPLEGRLTRDAILFLCTPGPQLALGRHIPLMKAWGFEPSGIGFVWVKLNLRADPQNFTLADLHMGPGHTTRKNCEFVLIGKRGKSLRKSCSEHSRKPEELYQRIEAYVAGEYGPYLELFARQRRPGWIAWGDEVDKFDPIENEEMRDMP